MCIVDCCRLGHAVVGSQTVFTWWPCASLLDLVCATLVSAQICPLYGESAARGANRGENVDLMRMKYVLLTLHGLSARRYSFLTATVYFVYFELPAVKKLFYSWVCIVYQQIFVCSCYVQKCSPTVHLSPVQEAANDDSPAHSPMAAAEVTLANMVTVVAV